MLDLSRVVAGNMVSLLLADFGAEVIKIETPEGDPLRDRLVSGIAANCKVYAHNKKSVCFNLRKSEGVELLLKLIATAGVLVENFRPGTLAEGISGFAAMKGDPRKTTGKSRPQTRSASRGRQL